MLTRSERGAILLPLALIVFIFSALLACWITWRLWQSGFPMPYLPSPGVAATPTQTTDSLLTAQFTVDDSLLDQEQVLEQKLFVPMRQYYATRTERLGNVSVKKSDDIDHSVSVTFNLISDSRQQTLSFFYDENKKGDPTTYPVWNPGLLDNTN